VLPAAAHLPLLPASIASPLRCKAHAHSGGSLGTASAACHACCAPLLDYARTAWHWQNSYHTLLSHAAPRAPALWLACAYALPSTLSGVDALSRDDTGGTHRI